MSTTNSIEERVTIPPTAADREDLPDLVNSSDELIGKAVQSANPMALRALLYQLTGDESLVSLETTKVMWGIFHTIVPANPADVEIIQRKAADFLRAHRDAGAPAIGPGPADRIPLSLSLAVGEEIDPAGLPMWIEELALDPWARGLNWRDASDAERATHFSVTVIGAGMGGLNAAVQLKRAGIPYTVLEKNSGVGGTWWENRYPGARVDSPSRSYSHIYGVDFGYPYPFCPQEENQKYFDWVADNFDVRRDVQFDTEVKSLEWDETGAMWVITAEGPDGPVRLRSNAVITSVGFLNRPNVPDIKGAERFRGGAWHASRWPAGTDVRGKRVAVIGTGCTGYQLVPQLALEADHVDVFQRTPQWVFGIKGYLSPSPVQVRWLDKNLPYHTNFMRFLSTWGIKVFGPLSEIDPNWDDPYSVSAGNKGMRDTAMEFMRSKIDDPELLARMTPAHPVSSARPVIADMDYCIYDALQRDNVTLVTDGVREINEDGIVANDGTAYAADIIVYATGFRASDYLFPMRVTGVGGKTLDDLWADEGARAYAGAMMPGFPNLWTIFGPNTSGALNVAGFHELIALFALKCMERLISEGKHEIEVTEDAYWRYNREVDERNRRRVWSDPRAPRNYYHTRHGRTATQCPFTGTEMWQYLHEPDFSQLIIR
jgi:4-hydroxyacetophenone monooxygenase